MEASAVPPLPEYTPRIECPHTCQDQRVLDLTSLLEEKQRLNEAQSQLIAAQQAKIQELEKKLADRSIFHETAPTSPSFSPASYNELSYEQLTALTHGDLFTKSSQAEQHYIQLRRALYLYINPNVNEFEEDSTESIITSIYQADPSFLSLPRAYRPLGHGLLGCIQFYDKTAIVKTRNNGVFKRSPDYLKAKIHLEKSLSHRQTQNAEPLPDVLKAAIHFALLYCHTDHGVLKLNTSTHDNSKCLITGYLDKLRMNTLGRALLHPGIEASIQFYLLLQMKSTRFQKILQITGFEYMPPSEKQQCQIRHEIEKRAHLDQKLFDESAAIQIFKSSQYTAAPQPYKDTLCLLAGIMHYLISYNTKDAYQILFDNKLVSGATIMPGTVAHDTSPTTRLILYAIITECILKATFTSNGALQDFGEGRFQSDALEYFNMHIKGKLSSLKAGLPKLHDRLESMGRQLEHDVNPRGRWFSPWL